MATPQSLEGPDTRPEKHDDRLIDLVRPLVGRFRERTPDGLRGILSHFLAERDSALSKHISHAGREHLQYYDELIFTALSLRYDALDFAVAESGFAIAEIDGEGRISYANPALQRILPDALGLDFASLFGQRADDVRAALSSGRRETLRLDLEWGDALPVHFSSEICPLRDEFRRGGAYALLLDLDGEDARFDAAPYGILRLDPTGTVRFANKEAEEMFGLSREALVGRPAEDLFGGGGDTKSKAVMAEWLASERGLETAVDLLPVDGRAPTPVRVTVTPWFDNSVSRAGALISFWSRVKEIALAKINKLIGAERLAPESLVEEVIKAVGPVVPFDFATFGLFADDMRHHQTIVLYPKPKWKWTTGWFQIDPAVTRKWLLGPETWGSDLGESVKSLAPDLAENEVVRNLVTQDKIKPYLTLPIRGGGDNFRAALTLYSAGGQTYGAEQRDQLTELGVDRALLIAEANIARRRESRVRDLESKLAAASDYRSLAQGLAEGIAACFGWDYVGVFEVDQREPGQFLLIAQCNLTGKPITVEHGYRQPLTAGLLGEARAKGAASDVPSIEPGTSGCYLPVLPECRSALAVPVRVAKRSEPVDPGQIELMLSVESELQNAFQGPSMTLLQKVLTQCEGVLRQRWQRAVQRMLLDAVEQAVVVVDRVGTVQLTNLRADDLYSSTRSLIGEQLASLGADSRDRRMLGSSEPVVQAHLALRAGELTRSILATQRSIGDDFGHRLWLFTDLREIDRKAEEEYLEQTVTEVAQTARLPLMLAGTFLRGAAKVLEQPAVKGLLDKAIRQLRKADITYERLASTLAVRQEPDQPRRVFDVITLLRHTIDSMPEEDMQACDVPDRDLPPFMIAGWPDQLGFAFRSMLAYLLIRRRPRSKLRVEIRDVGSSRSETLRIALSVALGKRQPEPSSATSFDPITTAAHKARVVAELAPETIELAVARHGGKFSQQASGRGRIMLTTTLPAAQLGSTRAGS
jgi:PAS domain S-box-containing protein